MAVGEAFLSAFLQVLFDRLASRELLEVATNLSFDADLKKLTLMVSKLNAVLKDAEEKQVKDMAIKIWLDELRDVADDAEDALDEFTTEILRSKLEAERKYNTNFMHQLFSPLNPVGAVFFNMQVASKLKAITERVEEIAKQTVELGLREDVGEKSKGIWRKLPTTSLVDDGIFGRVEDAKNLIEILRRDGDEYDGLCVIPIVGLGGIGKTTLAQIVYNDAEVDKHFDLKAWVYVSGDFDLTMVTKAILESFGESCDITNLEPLQSTLRKKLTMKKFLLVLDDLWDENYREWNILQLPFRAGAHGSKVIVTTRNQTVAQIVGTGPVFHLQQLSDDDCWLLFAKHAFSKFNFEARLDLESIGKNIARKCKGLPLAARALGGLLHSKLGVDEWQHVLNSEVWELPYQQCGILPELSLSYYHLPPHLKPCFAYCSIFPKGYEFDTEQLVCLWIAEGLVLQQEKHMQIEDVGSQYFRDLLSRSLFQRSGVNSSRFIMHDLINDLARFAAGERCLRLEEGVNQGKSWKKVHHLSYIRQRQDTVTKFEGFTSHKCLRTFLPLDGGFENCQIAKRAMIHILKTFNRLHVLSMSHYKITKLPDLIGELKHLRYLDLSNTLIELLPETVTKLYNLQTLILRGCSNLHHLPTAMADLVNLQHLDIRESNLHQLPPHMGRLKNLRMLPYFLVSRDIGCKISELKDLSNLKGDLCIFQLEHVDRDTDAVEANLKGKKYLNKLMLEWSVGSDGMLDEVVLNALQPDWNLRELSIKHYSGEKFPNWTKDPSFSKLVIITLSNCRNCKYLPPLGQLPSLKNLIIERMDKLCSISNEFYCDEGWFLVKPFRSLESLKFKDMPVWEEWFLFGAGEFPCLKELRLENCPKFSKEIPKSLASLKNLEIRNCKELCQIPCLPHIQSLVLDECQEAILESVVYLTSLEKLHLHKILELRYLPNEFFHRLTALWDLRVVNCSELLALSNRSGLPQNISLRRLTISNCFFSLLCDAEDWLPHQLEYFEIGNCENLIQLPHGLLGLKSLNKLIIINCPKLGALPEMNSPSNLRHLHIIECGGLRLLPEGLMCNENLSLEILEIDGSSSLKSFPDGELPLTIQSLKISNCPMLNELPAGLLLKNTCLESLLIHRCSLSSFPMTCSSPSQSFSVSSSSFSPPSGSNSSSRLKVLEVRDCFELKSLPDRLYNFLHLDKLEISTCPKLVSFPDGGLPPSLTSLSISECQHLKMLPQRLYNNALLQNLAISNCSGLQSYPEGGLPPNLKELCITGCNNLDPPSNWDLHKLSSLEVCEITNEQLSKANSQVDVYFQPKTLPQALHSGRQSPTYL